MLDLPSFHRLDFLQVLEVNSIKGRKGRMLPHLSFDRLDFRQGPVVRCIKGRMFGIPSFHFPVLEVNNPLYGHMRVVETLAFSSLLGAFVLLLPILVSVVP